MKHTYIWIAVYQLQGHLREHLLYLLIRFGAHLDVELGTDVKR